VKHGVEGHSREYVPAGWEWATAAQWSLDSDNYPERGQ